jgi:putative ABC transport system ATP-binding protein
MGMEASLIRYVWKHTWLQQLWILLVVALSMVPYFLSFDLPKRIVNGPIQGDGFAHAADRQVFLRLSIDAPVIGQVNISEGMALDRFQMLMALSLTFLALVVVNGLFKLYINTYKGRLGERMLRRIRYELVDRILRFPPRQFNRLKPAELATMVKDEVEPLGGFTGDAFVQPALLGGQAATTLVFIFVQNIWLGMITASIVAVQVGIIPRMRRKLLELGRQRQITARELAGRVSEIVQGIAAIHGNDTSNLERADIAWRLGRIFSIRYDLYWWKFLVKFINNFLAQVTPFLFYAVGGYFVLSGRLDIGQLVAVIAAYKDLPGPLKDLIDWDQARQDVQVKYAAVHEQFDVDRLLDPAIQALAATPAPAVADALVVHDLTLSDDSGARLLQGVSVEIGPDETVAVVGPPGSGAEIFAEALGRLAWADSGGIAIGGCNLLDLPEAVTGRRIAYASADTFFLHASLADNLFYGLKHAPSIASQDRSNAAALRAQAEARRAGNPTYDVAADWIDYGSVGARDASDLMKVSAPVLDLVQIGEDVFDLSLRSHFHPDRHPAIAEQVVRLRKLLRSRMDREDLHNLVIPFDFDLYNLEAAVGENLIFGVNGKSTQSVASLLGNQTFRSMLEEAGLYQDLCDMGRDIAETAVELLSDLPAHSPLFQQQALMAAAEIPFYQSILHRLRSMNAITVPLDVQMAMIGLSFRYIEPRHRFGLLTQAIKDKVIAARHRLHAALPAELGILSYHLDSLMPSVSLLDNVLFGRVVEQIADAQDQIRTVVRDLFCREGLYEEALAVGLQFDVGPGGRRLTMAQRQKINLARALLKQPDYLILNRPLTALDHAVQDQILDRIMQDRRQRQRRSSIICVLSQPRLAAMFDRVLVFQRGRLAASGTYKDLSTYNSIFKDMIS